MSPVFETAIFPPCHLAMSSGALFCFGALRGIKSLQLAFLMTTPFFLSLPGMAAW